MDDDLIPQRGVFSFAPSPSPGTASVPVGVEPK
jgi:hypothetical protein